MTADSRHREIDIAIVGGGPAGLAAALYAARALRSTVLFEGGVLGGQIAATDRVENYPGFPEGINGFDLALAMHQQAERFGTQTVYGRVSALRRLDDGRFLLEVDGGDSFVAGAVIVTAGAEPNKLEVPGEMRLTGRGVSYCATCDAAFFKDQPVAFVGGGDSAVEEALFTARFASHVTVIHRRDTLRASRVLQDRAFSEPKIEFIWNATVEEILGEDGVEALMLRDVETDERRRLDVAALFVFIGQTPNSNLLEGLVSLDEGGHARVDPWMATEVPGLFAAGDVRSDSARQVASAVGDGVTATIAAERYLEGREAEARR